MARFLLLICILILTALSTFCENIAVKDIDAEILHGLELLRRAESSPSQDAVPLYADAISILKNCDDDTYHRAYVGYANALSSSGRVYEALEIYSLILSENYLNEPILANCVFQMSNLMLDIGQYNKVERLLLPYLNREDLSKYPQLLSNYAASLAFQEKYTEALAILSTIVSNNSNLNAVLLQNKAFISMQAGQYSKACSYYERALQFFSGSDKGIVEANYALALAHCGKFNQALKVIDRALLKLRADKGIDYIRALRKNAEIHYLQGDKTKAFQSYEQFFDNEKEWLVSNLANFNNQQRVDLWSREKDLLSECFLLEDTAPDFTLDVALFRRLTSILGATNLDFGKYNSSNLRASLKKGDAAVEFIQYSDLQGSIKYGAIILTKSGHAKFVNLFEEDILFMPEQVRTNSIFNALRREDKSELNALYTDTIWSNKVWKPILSALPPRVNNIYFAPDGIFHLWAIENMPIANDGNWTFHRITALTNLIKDDKCHSTISSLPSLIIGGLDYDRNSSNNTDSTCPNREALNYLISQLGEYNHPFHYLEGTRAEADSVSLHFSNTVLRHNIHESELKHLISDFKLIHVATHGYSLNFGIKKQPELLNDSIPVDISLLGCGIALSGANNPNSINREDNLLSAREICDLDLSNVDFVVLSACQTAKGDIYDEGAAGLIRGLKNAGVKTILATLWSVDDKSTMLFMQEFYRLYEQGQSRHDAFIGAQNYLKNYVSKVPYRNFSPATLSRENEIQYHTITYNEPYYWAPFILIDDF